MRRDSKFREFDHFWERICCFSSTIFLQRYAVKEIWAFSDALLVLVKPTIDINFIDIFIIGANVVTKWYVSYLKAIISINLSNWPGPLICILSKYYLPIFFFKSSCLNWYLDHYRVALIMQERINNRRDNPIEIERGDDMDKMEGSWFWHVLTKDCWPRCSVLWPAVKELQILANRRTVTLEIRGRVNFAYSWASTSLKSD